MMFSMVVLNILGHEEKDSDYFKQSVLTSVLISVEKTIYACFVSHRKVLWAVLGNKSTWVMGVTTSYGFIWLSNFLVEIHQFPGPNAIFCKGNCNHFMEGTRLADDWGLIYIADTNISYVCARHSWIVKYKILHYFLPGKTWRLVDCMLWIHGHVMFHFVGVVLNDVICLVVL